MRTRMSTKWKVEKDFKRLVDETIEDPEKIFPEWIMTDEAVEKGFRSRVLKPKPNPNKTAAIIQKRYEGTLMGVIFNNLNGNTARFEIAHPANGHILEVGQIHEFRKGNILPPDQWFGHGLVAYYNTYHQTLEGTKMFELIATSSSELVRISSWAIPSTEKDARKIIASSDEDLLLGAIHTPEKLKKPHQDEVKIVLSGDKNGDRTTQVFLECTEDPSASGSFEGGPIVYQQINFLPLPHKIDIEKLMAMFKKRVIDATRVDTNLN